ncbi:MAG: thiamine-phosphate kinase [Gemmatimonadota bacterium]|nr:thiamine-phosphate kinase [Gemmatimonadota bacterium]MDE2985716.1 thiamine-phosphate kinase [Gemmatimonadota bacterium]
MNENELVRRLVSIGWRGSRAVRLGPGDDAAFLRGGMVISTDLAVEGVHFRLDWISPEEAGFRAGAAALSDLAAMGAAPEALLVSLAVRGEPSLALELQRGVRAAGDRVGVAIVGGDVSRSPGPAVLDVVAVGRARTVTVRGGAEVGQGVWVSGALGGAAAAVRAWEAGTEPDPRARERFVAPPDRVTLGVALADAGVARAMIDISDGLVADARRVADASRVMIRLDAGAIPVDDGAGDLNLALEGGEDYELMFTAPAGAGSRIRALGQEMAVALTRIGRVDEGEGVVLEDSLGRVRAPGRGGYDHFATPDPGGAS